VWVGELVEAGEGVTPPQLVRSSGVRISQNSDNAGFKTPLEMQILVDHNGNVTEVTLGEGGAGLSPRATRRAIAATTKTGFVAATKNGVPVKMWIPVVIDLESL